MSKIVKRAGWMFLAFLFLATSIGAGALVILQVHQQNKANQSAVDTAQKTAEAAKVTCSTDTSLYYSPPTGPLKGTKLTNFEPGKPVPALACIDLQVGTGPAVSGTAATVTVNYTGALASNGTIFESSLDGGQPFTTALNQVIPGWTNGLQGMKVGGTRRLLIPSAEAYGAQAQGSIPANSDLIFDITLTKTV